MDIMNAILDIEQKAREISDSTNELEQNQAEILQSEIKKREDKMAERLDKERAEIERVCFIKREDEMEKLERRYADRLEWLDKKCEQNKAEWVSTIVGNILGK